MNLFRHNPARSRRPGSNRERNHRRGIAIEGLERRTLLSSGMGVGMNLGGLSYGATDIPFANVMEMAKYQWNVTPAKSPGYPWNIPNVTTPSLDSNGYPIGLGNLPSQGYAMDTFVFDNQGEYYPTGTYTLTFDGSGTIAINDFVDPVQTFTQSGGTGQPQNVTISATSPWGIVIAITSSNPADYVQNIRLVLPGLQGTYQTQPFNPQYLSALQSFSTLRFMDMMLPDFNSATTSDGQSGELTWAERTTPTYFTQATPAGISVEDMVALCNTLQENMWVTMPVNADPNYELNFADYVSDNLDPGLKVYVEYGNELWNSNYQYEYNYVHSYAIANGINQSQAMADLATDNCWDIWLQAFGGQTGRMERVVAAQFEVPATFNQEITQLVAISSPSDPDHGFDVISGAAYYLPNTNSFNSQTTVQQFDAAEMTDVTGGFDQELQNFMTMRSSWETQLNQNIPVMMYEGGQQVKASTSTSWYKTYIAAQTDPGQFAVVMAYLNELEAAGVTEVNYFDFSQLPNQWGEYGSMDYLGEPSNLTPRYDALLDFIDPQSSAVILTPPEDTTTQGNWIGTYGAQGYDVIGDTPSLPSYATISASGESKWVWSTSTTARQALQNPGGSGRIEASWYSTTSFTVNLNLTDGQEHDIELYALDVQSSPQRVEQIQISDAATGTVLGTETVSSFMGGVYLNWEVSGDVVITITRKSGVNAVLSGIFIDPPPQASSATFLKTDTTTQGNWIGTYGAQGYDVIGDTPSLPSYATISASGESKWVWSTSTTVRQALQNPGGSGRIEASWYSTTSFTVNLNLTDGQEHDIELYVLDLQSSPSRVEQIQISDAATGTVLSTETVSSFTGGVYLNWKVSGDVVITITRESGVNAVLSGIFIDPSAPTSSATSLEAATTTQGSWIGTDGAQGYDVIGDTPSDPSYATASGSIGSTSTWAASMIDPGPTPQRRRSVDRDD